MEDDMRYYKGKDILVTGGCGSIGSELVKALCIAGAKRVRSFDNNEYGQFRLGEEVHSDNLRLLMGDVRDKARLKIAMKGVDVVFHCAALKHVPMCEYNPFEAVATNVQGTQNAIESARECKVGKFILISTDKAVNPINTMGATKLLCEKLVMNAPIGDDPTIFSCVRFGNVLESSGSVIPIFRKQIQNNEPITLTDESTTRFFMTKHDAINLIFKATSMAKGREIFILKMDSMKIVDLAMAMIEMHGSKSQIKTIGMRPGEKLHEALLTEEEKPYAREIDGMIVLKPGISVPSYIEDHSYDSKVSDDMLSSRNVTMDIEKIKEMFMLLEAR